MSVLIVEPSRLLQQIYCSMVEDLGQTAESIDTASGALSILEKGGCQVLIIAMHLADTTGINLCKWVRANPKLSGLPVVMTTSSLGQQERNNALEAGVTEVFHKNETQKLNDFLSYLLSLSSQSIGKILYVEDSKSVADIIVTMLELDGYEVEHFSGAEQALESFKENDYDLVLTDVVLEGQMTGYSLAREIRSMEGRHAMVPILAMTSFDDTARRVELLRAGVNDYIAKPAIDEELKARIRNLVASKKQLDKIELQQAQLREMAMTDQLTGLYNRHFLMGVGHQRISEALRHQVALSVIVVDIDKFKHVNDTYGHAVGDVVLTEVGKLLRESCRNEDVAARFGGEEFVLMLTHCSLENAEAKAENIRQRLEVLKPADILVTASFGVTALDLRNTDTPCDFSTLFNEADQAVYKAKERGRNRVVVASLRV